jgi:hypothetical protein
MKTCELIQEELVAYRDGELSDQAREQVTAHLQTCSACAREEARLAHIEQLLMTMERVTPSPQFAAAFWQRLEQEKAQSHMAEPSIPLPREHRLSQWWREVKATLSGWQVAPVLAAAASVLVFVGYLLHPQPTPSGKPESASTAPIKSAAPTVHPVPEAPADLVDKLGLFVNYRVIADLDRLSHFDEIASVQLPPEQETQVAKEEELPPDLLQNPSFFAHYPILKKMDQLQHLEAVLEAPPHGGEGTQSHG